MISKFHREMKYLIVVLVSLLLLGLCFGARNKAKIRVRSLKFECDHDESVTTDMVCKMVTLPTGGANLTFGATLVTPVNVIWVTVETFKKEGRDDFKPMGVGTKVELCDLIGDNSNHNVMLDKIWPDAKTEFEKYIHPCPYSGTFLVENFQADGDVVSKFFPTGSYKLDFNIFDGDNVKLFSLKYYFYINNFF